LKSRLTEKEKLVLYGLVKYPKLTYGNLAKKIGLKHSTVTAIRLRQRQKNYYRCIRVPMLQGLGCEMLVVIYTNFNPVIPLEERVITTGKTIEVFEELFYSIGEQDKGFSLSLAKDYASIGKINDIRTQAFGGCGILEDEYPNMVLFPFGISRIYRFFDFEPLLRHNFNLDIKKEANALDYSPKSKENIIFNETEKNVYYMLIQHPELSDGHLGKKLGISRHTVSRLRRNFEQENLMKKNNLPNLQKLGFEILTFMHIQYDPRNPPDIEKDEAMALMGDETIFMASRTFETVMLMVYSDYDAYKQDRNRIMQVLKENKWITKDPLIRTYGLNTSIVIKDYIFAPIAKKIIGCTL
jgi:DNA-binding MarR family transcriptional regulator